MVGDDDDDDDDDDNCSFSSFFGLLKLTASSFTVFLLYTAESCLLFSFIARGLAFLLQGFFFFPKQSTLPRVLLFCTFCSSCSCWLLSVCLLKSSLLPLLQRSILPPPGCRLFGICVFTLAPNRVFHPLNIFFTMSASFAKRNEKLSPYFTGTINKCQIKYKHTASAVDDYTA